MSRYNDGSRHKKTQDQDVQYKHRKSGHRTHKNCHISKCGCGWWGKKPKNVPYPIEDNSWFVPFLADKKTYVDEHMKRTKSKVAKWRKKHAKTKWLPKVKKSLGG